jgi:hypothetical protein
MPNPTLWGFRRTSVVEQAAAALRDAIRRGELRDPLPGGHQLARQLGVSRPTLRAALHGLAAEGLLVVNRGRRTRLATRVRSRSSDARPTVCVVCPASMTSPAMHEHPILLEMHVEFASRGVRWEVIFETRLGGAQPFPRLEQLVAARPNVCWILFAATEPIHRWFAARQLPTVVVGSKIPGLNLPATDLDYAGLGWHAAGMFVRYGHRRIALVLPERPLPGDLVCRTRFVSYVEKRAPDVRVDDCRVPDDPAHGRAAIARLLGGPRRPTGVLSLRQGLTLAVLRHALGRGLRIPADLSLVSRDTHMLFESGFPELTRYSGSARKLASRAVRIALHLLAGRKAPARPSLVTPTFIPGSTLAACPV